MKKAGIVFLILIILITISIKIIDLSGAVDNNDDQNILVEVKRGTSAQEIVDTLHIHNLIKSRLLFKSYLYLSKTHQNLQAGYYYFTRSMNMFEIAERLKRGGNAVFRITIPEGFTVVEILDILLEKSKNDRESYENDLKNGNFAYDFLPEDNKDYIYRLEGYLFPDTYTIPLGFDAKETINVFLKSFESKVLNKIINVNNNKVSKYSLHQLITIASLVEREAKFDDEKPIIASVIYNRLNQDMLLQVDASVQYILEEKKQRLLYKDLEIDSPYNTYLYKGLPPGPICNPGIRSFEAVLEPAETEYLFYFALENGRHVFTKSYEEHIRKQQEVK